MHVVTVYSGPLIFLLNQLDQETLLTSELREHFVPLRRQAN